MRSHGADVGHLLRTVTQTLGKDMYTSLVVIHKKDIREPHDLTT